MSLIRFRPSVRLTATPALARELAALDYAAHLCGTDLLVTCGTEDHPPDDPHTRGVALDVGAADLPAPLVLAVLDALRRFLGAPFTVLYEVPTRPALDTLALKATINPAATGTHFHLQPVKGTAWPPV